MTNLVAAVVVVVVSVLSTSAEPSLPKNLRPLVGHQVWELTGEAGHQTAKALEINGLVDILERTPDTSRFSLSPDVTRRVLSVLTHAGLSHHVLVTDLAEYIQSTERRVYKLSTRAQPCVTSNCPQPFADAFMTFKQIEYYLQHIARSGQAEVRSIGMTFECRDIWLVHIKPNSRKKNGGMTKNVWIEGGIHAREWISPITSLHLIHNMIQPEFLATNNADIYVVPMTNPDGYVYSWTQNRMWRKNRALTRSSCIGVDLNRNWDTAWGVGASTNPCSIVFQGDRPFSEPETKALSTEMERLNTQGKFDLVLALHSYGNIIMYPWGYTKTDPAPDTPEMKAKGEIFANAVRTVYGTKYRVVNSAIGLYEASGTTDDWAKQALGTKYVYTVELPGPGFTIPPNKIDSVAKETWTGVRKLLQAI